MRFKTRKTVVVTYANNNVGCWSYVERQKSVYRRNVKVLRFVLVLRRSSSPEKQRTAFCFGFRVTRALKKRLSTRQILFKDGRRLLCCGAHMKERYSRGFFLQSYYPHKIILQLNCAKKCSGANNTHRVEVFKLWLAPI